MFHVLGMGYLLRLSLRLRIPKSCVVAAVGAPASCSVSASASEPEASGFGFQLFMYESHWFGFGFQIMILEATGFGFGFLNFKTEATGFGFGLGFPSPSWLRLRLGSHQPGFQPNPDLHTDICVRTSPYPNLVYESKSWKH